MKLSEEVKQEIRREYNSWFDSQYGDKTLQERRKLGAFYTPADVSIQMIESYDLESLENQTILDPTCGSGNLLMACLIAGAKPENLYGNEFDIDMLKLCRDRMDGYCKEHNLPKVPKKNLHQGDAEDDRCFEFSSSYKYPFPEPTQIDLW